MLHSLLLLLLRQRQQPETAAAAALAHPPGCPAPRRFLALLMVAVPFVPMFCHVGSALAVSEVCLYTRNYLDAMRPLEPAGAVVLLSRAAGGSAASLFLFVLFVSLKDRNGRFLGVHWAA